MNAAKLFLIITIIMITSCSMLNPGSADLNAELHWPVTVVPWEGVLSRIDSAEVVILCLVNTYDQSKRGTSTRNQGPTWFPSDRQNVVTAAQVLESYLRGARSLEGNGLMLADGTPDPKKMSIFIVEGGEYTRAWAGALFTKLGVRYYDESIPVIYVFHNKKFITSFTYIRNPGEQGPKLKSVIHDLLQGK